jgi:hypothetical protein
LLVGRPLRKRSRASHRSNYGDVIAPEKDVEVYLVPLSLAKLQNHLRSRGGPRDARWLPLGPPRQDEHGVIRMWITVPQVPNGYYTVGFWCKWCGPPKADFFTSAFPGQRWSGRRHYTILRVTEPRPPLSEAVPATPTSGSGSKSPVWSEGEDRAARRGRRAAPEERALLRGVLMQRMIEAE